MRDLLLLLLASARQRHSVECPMSVIRRALLLQLAFVIALIVAFAETKTTFAQESKGKFVGDLILKVLPDGRNMRLMQPFSYIDSKGVSWSVPPGTQVDGASIPAPLWSIVGAPYTGKYREASVIHDHYCVARTRHWKAVHRVLLDGMLTNGVDPIQAKVMYLAVYRFGPRWDFDANACSCRGCPTCSTPVYKRFKTYKPKFEETELKDLQLKLKSGAYTIEQLEALSDYQISTAIFGK